MANKRNVRLKTIGDVSVFLAKVINQFNRDEIEAAKASKLGYLCNIMVGLLKDSELEERVRLLEESVEKRG